VAALLFLGFSIIFVPGVDAYLTHHPPAVLTYLPCCCLFDL
jgi:hypothetical protein